MLRGALLLALGYLTLVVESLPDVTGGLSLVPAWLVLAVLLIGRHAIPLGTLLGLGLDGLTGSGFGIGVLFCTVAAAILEELRTREWLTSLLPSVLVLLSAACCYEGASLLREGYRGGHGSGLLLMRSACADAAAGVVVLALLRCRFSVAGVPTLADRTADVDAVLGA